MSNKKLIIYFKVPSVSKFRGNAWYLLYWKYVFKTEWSNHLSRSSQSHSPSHCDNLMITRPSTIPHSLTTNLTFTWTNLCAPPSAHTYTHDSPTSMTRVIVKYAKMMQTCAMHLSFTLSLSLSPNFVWCLCLCTGDQAKKKVNHAKVHAVCDPLWRCPFCAVVVVHHWPDFYGAHFYIVQKSVSLSLLNKSTRLPPASSPGTGFERRGREFESCPSPWYYHHVLFSFSSFYVLLLLLLLLQVGIACVYVYVCAWNLCSCVEHASHALFEFFFRAIIAILLPFSPSFPFATPTHPVTAWSQTHTHAKLEVQTKAFVVVVALSVFWVAFFKRVYHHHITLHTVVAHTRTILALGCVITVNN